MTGIMKGKRITIASNEKKISKKRINMSQPVTEDLASFIFRKAEVSFHRLLKGIFIIRLYVGGESLVIYF